MTQNRPVVSNGRIRFWFLIAHLMLLTSLIFGAKSDTDLILFDLDRINRPALRTNKLKIKMRTKVLSCRRTQKQKRHSEMIRVPLREF